jgi:formylmethanofuran:tetrahydromethanopterin formyltransferase
MSEKTAEKQPANGQLTAEQMRQAIAADEAARAQACMEAVNAALAEYDCELVVVPTLTPDGRVTATATIKAK